MHRWGLERGAKELCEPSMGLPDVDHRWLEIDAATVVGPTRMSHVWPGPLQGIELTSH